MPIRSSELILNPDGSVYHLHLMPEHIGSEIITVGDPDRVDLVAKHLDTVGTTICKREFKTVTGRIGNKRISIISTGIGTDNIDIVLNELDALVNIDLQTRELKTTHTPLNIYRIGTSGAINQEVPIDSFVASEYAIGLDGLLHFYQRNLTTAEVQLEADASVLLKKDLPNVIPYASCASHALIARVPLSVQRGITVTADGFYGPQGRQLRAQRKNESFLDDIRKLQYKNVKTTNLEMETAGIYGLSSVLGHHAISLNAIIANRVTGEFSNQPLKTVERLIELFFEEILLD